MYLPLSNPSANLQRASASTRGGETTREEIRENAQTEGPIWQCRNTRPLSVSPARKVAGLDESVGTCERRRDGVLDVLCPVAFVFREQVVLVAAHPTRTCQSQNARENTEHALEINRETVDISQPVARNPAHNNRTRERFECTIGRGVYVGLEGPVRACRERDDDFDLAVLGIFEPFGRPGVDGGDDGGFCGDCCVERPCFRICARLSSTSVRGLL